MSGGTTDDEADAAAVAVAVALGAMPGAQSPKGEAKEAAAAIDDERGEYAAGGRQTTTTRQRRPSRTQFLRCLRGLWPTKALGRSARRRWAASPKGLSLAQSFSSGGLFGETQHSAAANAWPPSAPMSFSERPSRSRSSNAGGGGGGL